MQANKNKFTRQNWYFIKKLAIMNFKTLLNNFWGLIGVLQQFEEFLWILDHFSTYQGLLQVKRLWTTVLINVVLLSRSQTVKNLLTSKREADLISNSLSLPNTPLRNSAVFLYEEPALLLARGNFYESHFEAGPHIIYLGRYGISLSHV